MTRQQDLADQALDALLWTDEADNQEKNKENFTRIIRLASKHQRRLQVWTCLQNVTKLPNLNEALCLRTAAAFRRLLRFRSARREGGSSRSHASRPSASWSRSWGAMAPEPWEEGLR